MNQRLKELADAVAEILAKRWLEQEERLAGKENDPSARVHRNLTGQEDTPARPRESADDADER